MTHFAKKPADKLTAAEAAKELERLVAWLAGRAIDDLAIGRPDLEALFRQYYTSEAHGA